ncbi:MAG: amidohydrolase family protein [Novosphingobium sp.]|nr:amidohydrolase family protein [Novosphingobium sp.]
MSLDIKITGATILDGTGGDRFTADIGVSDGRICEIGRISTAASRVIDADGAIVTPGFIDMHTHYDAQVLWDQDLIASSRNGVTTAVMGNCGVGCAPFVPAIRDDLISLLEGVEDIPTSALEAALDWKWSGFGSYLDKVDELPRTINLAAYVAHAPMRMIAMGERAYDGSAPGEDDIAAMNALLSEALAAGAAAFSTDRIGLHQTGDGRQVPDFHAPREEVLSLARTVARFGGRPIQFASDFGMIGTEEDTLRELSILRELTSLDLPLIVPLQQYPCEGGWRRLASDIGEMTRQGAKIAFEACARAIGVLMGLEALVHPFCRHPSYMEIADLPLAERARRMRDPAFRARLMAEQPQFGANDGRVRRRFDQMYQHADHIFLMESSATYEPDPEKSIKSIAERTGKTLEEVFYEALTAKGGKQFLYFPIANFADGKLDEQREILNLPNSLFSFGDAGAHLAQICDAAYSSFALMHWGRDRPEGLPLEMLVRKMTGAQADLFGFTDRGRIAVGAMADLNIIDHAAMKLEDPQMLHDLPGGASRLMQCAEGYIATLVGGLSIAENDNLTGALPGKLLRSA